MEYDIIVHRFRCSGEYAAGLPAGDGRKVAMVEKKQE
jgi:hypothetical protein